jgi:hypothetical protein
MYTLAAFMSTIFRRNACRRRHEKKFFFTAGTNPVGHPSGAPSTPTFFFTARAGLGETHTSSFHAGVIVTKAELLDLSWACLV